MKRLWALCAVLACSPLAYAQAAGPGQIEFSFKYQPGKVSRHRLVDKSVGSMKLPDPLPEMKFSQSFEQLLVSECRKVNPDGSALVDISIAQVAMKMNMGPISVSYDSSRPSAQTQPDSMDSILARIFSGMVGMKLTATLSNTGQLTNLEGVSQAIKKMIAGIQSANTSPMVKEVLDQMGDELSDNMWTQQVQSCYRMLPDRKGPFRVGDKWDREWSDKLPMIPMGVKQRGDYELAGIEQFRGHPCAKIRFKETMTMTSAPAQAGPKKGLAALFDRMDFRISGSGGDGVAYVDYMTGDVVQIRQVMDLTLQFAPKPNAQAAGQPADKSSGQSDEMPMPSMVQKLKTSMTLDLEEGAETRPAEKTAAQPNP